MNINYIYVSVSCQIIAASEFFPFPSSAWTSYSYQPWFKINVGAQGFILSEDLDKAAAISI